MNRKRTAQTFGVLLAACILCGSVSARAAETIDARVKVEADKPGARIDPNIYGQFVEHLGRGVYEGIWVGEDSSIPNVRGIRSDVVSALRRIHVPLVRWPGGCFAELYHWRDGIGARDRRPRNVNSAWGDEPETNAFGTHEFMDFLEQIGAKAFISVNVTTGTAGEARDWLQYMTEPADSALGSQRAANGHPRPYEVPFVGIGNETWGCGGNMTASHYADVYRAYVSALRAPSRQLIATDANSDDYDWTATLLDKALFRHTRAFAESSELAYVSRQPQIDMMSIHFYTFSGNDWGKKSPALGFSASEWAQSMLRTSRTDEMIQRHSDILDQHDPDKRIGLSFSEWGTWWAKDEKRPSNLYQQNTLRDAVIAGLTLNIFQNRADRVRMANIAQMINVLQSMILTRGKEMVLTPTYHVFDLYHVHQGATLLPVQIATEKYASGTISLPSISVSASRDEKGRVHLSLVNLDPDRDASIAVALNGMRASSASARVLTADAMDAHNDFDAPQRLAPRELRGVSVRGGGVKLTVPAKSVTVVELRP
ncbi:MAG TPA: alpha-L-arabinofuranosidase C-terminal domain-containing protein [Steroidobacteraceae bacterium]|nr:alpha-L-arabinofuranosidase C-terminal domain-containing protein [Steroidobacteraceae bacterium]